MNLTPSPSPDPDNVGQIGVAATFVLASLVAYITILGRLGYQIAHDPAPMEPAAYTAWRRKWLWIVVGETLTVPALGIGWTGAVYYWALSVPLTVGGAMVGGALGFGFWLDALRRVMERKIDHVA